MTDDLGVVDEQAAARASADNEARRTDARVLCPPDFFICVKCLSPSVPAKTGLHLIPAVSSHMACNALVTHILPTNTFRSNCLSQA